MAAILRGLPPATGGGHISYVSVASVRAALDSGALPAANCLSATDPSYPPIVYAAGCGAVDVCKLLIARGADVNLKGSGQHTALHSAASRGYKEVCEFLLSKGAKINAVTDEGVSPLYHAAQSGHMAVCKLLISKGANLELQAKRATALYAAAQMGMLDVVHLLIAAGARLTAADGRKTPLFGAAAVGKLDVVKVLIAAGAPVNDPASGTCFALLTAANLGYVDTCAALLAAGANVHSADAHGFTALHAAASGGAPAVCRLLVKYGEPLHALNIDGATALQLTVCKGAVGSRGHYEACEYLLSVGAAEWHKDAKVLARSTKRMPLLDAAIRGDAAICELLLSYGESVNRGDDGDGETPLMRAAASGRLDLCELLVRAGASVHGASTSAHTALLYAAGVEDGVRGRAIVALLLDEGAGMGLAPQATGGRMVWKATGFGDGLRTPLQLAAMKGRVPACQLLFAYGADTTGVHLPQVAIQLPKYLATCRNAGWRRRCAALVAFAEWQAELAGQPAPPFRVSMGADSGPQRESCHVCALVPAGGKELSRCARCKSVSYCSRACQTADWAEHKSQCERGHQ